MGTAVGELRAVVLAGGILTLIAVRMSVSANDSSDFNRLCS